MSEREVERDVEGLAEVTEAFHEARAAAQGELTRVDVETVHVRGDHQAVCLEVETRAGREWLLFESDARLHRGDLLDRFEGVSGLQSLEGETWETFLDREAGVVRPSAEGRELGTIHSTEPRVEVRRRPRTERIHHGHSPRTEHIPITRADRRYGGGVKEFDRLARVEAAMDDGRPPGTDVDLRVEGADGEMVRATAEIGGEEFQWLFEVPGPNEFEDADLTRLVEAVDAGDPAGLDGHRVRVCLEAETSPGRSRFECESGVVSIVPETDSGLNLPVDLGIGEVNDVDDSIAALGVLLTVVGTIATSKVVAGVGGLVLIGWMSWVVLRP